MGFLCLLTGNKNNVDCLCRLAQVPVLSVDHRGGVIGKFFNFMRKSLPGFETGPMRLKAMNSRTRQCGNVRLWANTNGGSIGDAHGRFENEHREGQWEIGDKVLLNTDDCGK